MHLILILDENVIAGVSGDRGVPSESNDYIIGPTIHPTAGDIHSSCVDQDKHSIPVTQQQNNGRSGGSSDDANNTGSIKGYHSNHTWFIHYLGICSYELSGKYIPYSSKFSWLKFFVKLLKINFRDKNFVIATFFVIIAALRRPRGQFMLLLCPQFLHMALG